MNAEGKLILANRQLGKALGQTQAGLIHANALLLYLLKADALPLGIDAKVFEELIGEVDDEKRVISIKREGDQIVVRVIDGAAAEAQAEAQASS